MWSRKRRLVIAGVAAAIVVAIFLVLVLVPVPQNFTMRDVSFGTFAPACSGILTTKGTTVSYQWSAPSNISFGVYSCATNWVVHEGSGTSGSGSITSVGGVYEFGAICGGPGNCVTATVTGTYTGPLLQL